MTEHFEDRPAKPEIRPIPQHYGVIVGLAWGVLMFFLMGFLLEGGAFRADWSEGIPTQSLVGGAVAWIGGGGTFFGATMKWWAVRQHRRQLAEN